MALLHINLTASGGALRPFVVGCGAVCAMLLASPRTAAAAGPVVTFFGLADANDALIPSTDLGTGLPVFQVSAGSGFRLVIEGRPQPGPSGAPVGTSSFGSSSDPSGTPDLQIISSRDLGIGSAPGCGNLPSDEQSVPAETDFSSADALNRFGCHFVNDDGQPVGRSSDAACLFNASSGQAQFVNAASTIEFCTPPSSLTFSGGDTVITVRLRDVNGAVGPAVMFGVRVGTVTPPTTTPTSAGTAIASATPTTVAPAPTATRTPTASVTSAPTVTPTELPATASPTPPACAGDCDGDHHVRVEELWLGTEIALAARSVADCPVFACHPFGVSVDCILGAVNVARTACPG